MSDTETLLKLKEAIEAGKVEINKLEGAKVETTKTLKKEFGCKGLKSAKKLLQKMEEEVEKESKILGKQINNLTKKIGGKFNG